MIRKLIIANIMKQLLSVGIILIGFNAIGQSAETMKYNLSIIDSCIAKIDTSIKVVQFRFVNGKDHQFQQKFINSIDSIEFIDYVLYDFSPDYSKTIENRRAMTIAIYYESTSCIISTCYLTKDSLTSSTTESSTDSDKKYCWTFKKGEQIKACVW